MINKIASSSTNFFSEGYSILRQRFGNDSFWLHGPYHYIMKAIFQVGWLINSPLDCLVGGTLDCTRHTLLMIKIQGTLIALNIMKNNDQNPGDRGVQGLFLASLHNRFNSTFSSLLKFPNLNSSFPSYLPHLGLHCISVLSSLSSSCKVFP